MNQSVKTTNTFPKRSWQQKSVNGHTTISYALLRKQLSGSPRVFFVFLCLCAGFRRQRNGGKGITLEMKSAAAGGEPASESWLSQSKKAAAAR